MDSRLTLYPGTVHLPFLIIVSTDLRISGRASETSSIWAIVNTARMDGAPRTHSQVLEWSSVFDVGQGIVERFLLCRDLRHCLLRRGNLRDAPSVRHPII